MTFHEYLAKARQEDAQQAGERDRLLQEAQLAHGGLSRTTARAGRARRLARLILRRLLRPAIGC